MLLWSLMIFRYFIETHEDTLKFKSRKDINAGTSLAIGKFALILKPTARNVSRVWKTEAMDVFGDRVIYLELFDRGITVNVNAINLVNTAFVR